MLKSFIQKFFEMCAHIAGVLTVLMFVATIFVSRDQIWAHVRENGRIAILSFFGLGMLWWLAFGLEEEGQETEFARRRRGSKDADHDRVDRR